MQTWEWVRLPFDPFFGLFYKMQPAQLCNVAKASLAPLPRVREFCERIQRHLDSPQAANDEDLFQEAFTHPRFSDGRAASKKVQRTAFRAMNDFQKVLNANGLDVQDLDEFFRKFAKWALKPSAMFQEEQQVAEFAEQRRLLCVQAGVKLHVLLHSVTFYAFFHFVSRHSFRVRNRVQDTVSGRHGFGIYIVPKLCLRRCFGPETCGTKRGFSAAQCSAAQCSAVKCR